MAYRIYVKRSGCISCLHGTKFKAVYYMERTAVFGETSRNTHEKVTKSYLVGNFIYFKIVNVITAPQNI